MALAIAITTLLLFTVAFRGDMFVAAETNPMRLGLSRVNMAVAEGEDLAMKYNITLSKPLPDNVAYHVTIRDNSHPACEGQLDITPRAAVLKGDGNSYVTVSVRALDDRMEEAPLRCVIEHNAYAVQSSEGLDVEHHIEWEPSSALRVAIFDDDMSMVVLSARPRILHEDTNTVVAAYDAVLASEPRDTVTVVAQLESCPACDPQSVSFTALNWKTPQSIHISLPNIVMNGGHLRVEHSIRSADVHYQKARFMPRNVITIHHRPWLANVSECVKCKENTFSPQEGSAFCQPCSASSRSSPGSTSCTCIGAHRYYQTGTGLCLCRPRYEFFDEQLRPGLPFEDSTIDCQPKVFRRCSRSEIRDADGNCIDIEEADMRCSSYCAATHSYATRNARNASIDRMSRATGHCVCATQPDLSQVCDEDCRQMAPKARIVSDKVSGVSSYRIEMPDGHIAEEVQIGRQFAGAHCNHRFYPHSDRCAVVPIEIRGGQFMGLLNAAVSLDSGAVVMASSETLSEHGDGRGRALTATFYNDSVASAGISQPLTCIIEGDSVIFTFTLASWPVIVKDSTLNTWKTTTDFDPSGRFVDLDTKCSAGACPRTFTRMRTAKNSEQFVFGHQFIKQGTYVFALSDDLKQQMVVVVMPSGSRCPLGTYVLPYTDQNAVALGLRKDPTLVQEPDWGLLGLLLGGLFGMVFIVIGTLYYLRSHAYSRSPHTAAPKYRKRNRRIAMKKMHQKGSVLRVEEKEAAAKFVSERKMEHPGSQFSSQNAINAAMAGVAGAGALGVGGGGGLDRWDADDLDLRELLERLEANREAVLGRLGGTDQLVANLTKDVLDALRKETDELKRLLAETHLLDPDGQKGKSDSLLRLLEQEISAWPIHT
eukprot:g2590.t1